MTLERTTRVWCDYDDGEVRCPFRWERTSEHHQPTSREVRGDAYHFGWVRKNGKDYCATHAHHAFAAETSGRGTEGDST